MDVGVGARGSFLKGKMRCWYHKGERTLGSQKAPLPGKGQELLNGPLLAPSPTPKLSSSRWAPRTQRGEGGLFP